MTNDLIDYLRAYIAGVARPYGFRSDSGNVQADSTQRDVDDGPQTAVTVTEMRSTSAGVKLGIREIDVRVSVAIPCEREQYDRAACDAMDDLCDALVPREHVMTSGLRATTDGNVRVSYADQDGIDGVVVEALCTFQLFRAD